MDTKTRLVPLLVVRGAAHAIDFYEKALGAQVVARYQHGPRGHVSHADLALADAVFSVTEEVRAFNSDAPPSLGGSPVVLQLMVMDVDAVLASVCEAGATVVFPPQELLGERMARVRDPFGHLWILRQPLEELSIDEIQRERDALFSRFAAAQREDGIKLTEARPVPQVADDRGRVHLVVGPIGAGKSTYAAGLTEVHAAVRVTLDEWMAGLFRPDRPDSGVLDWYRERAGRCVRQIWSVAQGIVTTGTDVILEIGLLQRHERSAFYRNVERAELPLTIHVLEAPRDVRRRRVEERNRTQGSTFSMIVPPDVFELASDLWEPVEPDECRGRDVKIVTTDL